MPLTPKKRKQVSRKVRKLRKEGIPPKQAVARALKRAGVAKNKR